MAGITADGVRMYRQRHEIPAAQTRRAPKKRQHSTLQGAQLNGYLVTVEQDNQQTDYLVLAKDLAEAAEKTQASMEDQSVSILGIRYVAPAI